MPQGHKDGYRLTRITNCRWKTDPDPIAQRNTKQIQNFSLRSSVTNPGDKSTAKPGQIDTRVPFFTGWPCTFRRTIPMD